MSVTIIKRGPRRIIRRNQVSAIERGPAGADGADGTVDIDTLEDALVAGDNIEIERVDDTLVITGEPGGGGAPASGGRHVNFVIRVDMAADQAAVDAIISSLAASIPPGEEEVVALIIGTAVAGVAGLYHVISGDQAVPNVSLTDEPLYFSRGYLDLSGDPGEYQISARPTLWFMGLENLDPYELSLPEGYLNGDAWPLTMEVSGDTVLGPDIKHVVVNAVAPVTIRLPASGGDFGAPGNVAVIPGHTITIVDVTGLGVTIAPSLLAGADTINGATDPIALTAVAFNRAEVSWGGPIPADDWYLTDHGSGAGGASLSDDLPAPLGIGSEGVSDEASRSDHVHAMPTPADVGADQAGAADEVIALHLLATDPHGDRAYTDAQIAGLDGGALSDADPEALGVTDPGVAEEASRADHVHAMPTKANIGLGSVDNTADTAKPVSTAQQTALDAKVPTSRTVNGQALSANVTLTKSDVGLGSADNTADTAKPVSTAQQTAIDAKVADAINNGTTTIAPSQNAVFDALALKQTTVGVAPMLYSGARQFNCPGVDVSISATTTIAVNTLYMIRCAFNVPWTLTELAILIATGQTGNAHLVMYAAAEGWVPTGAPVAETTAASCAAAGALPFAVTGGSVSGQPGNYLLGVETSATGLVIRNATQTGLSGDTDAALIAANSTSASLIMNLRRLAHTFGTAMPSSPAFTNYTATSSPLDLVILAKWSPT